MSEAAKPGGTDPQPRPLGERVRFIWSLWEGQRRFLGVLAALTLISSAVAAAYPVVVKFVIDGVEARIAAGRAGGGAAAERAAAEGVGAGGGLALDLLFVLGLIAVGRVVALQYPCARAFVNMRIAQGVRRRVLARVLAADGRLRSGFRTGDLTTRLTSDLDDYPALAWFACSGIFRAVESASKAGLSVAAMVWLSPAVTAAALLPLPLMLYVFYRVRRRLTEAYLGQQEARSRTSDLLEAAFSGIQIVKAFRAASKQSERLGEVLRERVALQHDVQRLNAAIHTADALASRLGQVVALVFGGYLVIEGRLAVGALYAIYVYLDMLVHPLQDLPNLLVTARQAFGSMDRVIELDEAAVRSSSRAPADGALGHAGAAGAGETVPAVAPPALAAVEVRGARVRYPALDAAEDAKRPLVLDGVSLRVGRGERVAVVGPVGSGKTTLLRLVAGLVPPADGEVRWNGEPVGYPLQRGVRERIGYVPQEAPLFGASIRWNVCFDREREQAMLEQALACAQLTDDLARMPQGADTPIGPRGSGVSGGQRQRIAIARAVARRPDLLVLDDSTAALDAVGEHKLWDALAEVLPDAATLVSTHRLATVERADRVVVLDRGRVIAEGTHDQLRRESPAYRRLLALGT